MYLYTLYPPLEDGAYAGYRTGVLVVVCTAGIVACTCANTCTKGAVRVDSMHSVLSSLSHVPA